MNTKTYFRNSLLLSFLLGIANVMFAQNTKEFSLKGFDKLDMSSAFIIDVKYGNAYKVLVDAERTEDIEDLEVKVSGTTLIAKYRNSNGGWKWNNSRKKVSFTIVMPNLKQVDFSGATRSKISGFDDLEDITLKFSGAATTEININADKVNLDCSGASRVKLNGKTSKLNFDLSGASNVDSYNFVARDVDAEVSGASSARVNASKTLNVEASGASSVRYKGQPSVRSDVSGASSVKSGE
ncbi:head GIN domain-containing protein [Arcicella aquatica]|uniref:Head GIN domain-containing protein n=1 Tax=Arcicella aquatica TaxID=217141 RepID=A0ABU5QNJ5_9BACT|nr:head GIN domain-containing protein [Arcicella aquatica]MEA5258294.1 head GIN domain-containing protein [Arcicella aquatica]